MGLRVGAGPGEEVFSRSLEMKLLSSWLAVSSSKVEMVCLARWTDTVLQGAPRGAWGRGSVRSGEWGF